MSIIWRELANFHIYDYFWFFPIIGHTEILHSQQEVKSKRKEMSDAERWNVYNALLKRSVNGHFKRITTKDVSDLLSIPMQTVKFGGNQRILLMARMLMCHIGGKGSVVPKKTNGFESSYYIIEQQYNQLQQLWMCLNQQCIDV